MSQLRRYTFLKHDQSLTLPGFLVVPLCLFLQTCPQSRELIIQIHTMLSERSVNKSLLSARITRLLIRFDISG